MEFWAWEDAYTQPAYAWNFLPVPGSQLPYGPLLKYSHRQP